MARLVRVLVSVRGADELANLTDGMSLHVWLQHTARCTHAEARDLLGTAEVLAHMPATLAGLGDGWLSWSQVSALARAARRVPVARRVDLDALVGDAMVSHRDWEPDALVAESLDAPLGPPVTPPEDLGDVDAVDGALDTLDEQRRALTRHHGRRLADRLVDLCEAELAGALDDTSADDRTGATDRPRPLVLATVDLEALLDATRIPGWLLHTLAGGRMQLTSTALQRLVDARGADLRTIVLDDAGQAIGVGRRGQVPPGWLREAIWARDTVVRDPDGTTPVRRADLDHVTPWPDGTTDGDNLAPLGRPWHRSKTSRRWTVHRVRDGTTTWTHRRHGWTIRLAPPRRDLTDVPDRGPPRLPLGLATDPGSAHEPGPT